uniref:Glyoxylate reductase/hydroxypyruvate reductase n=1 Tax=Cynoglossus semilaevis TaxID=244447 RepID=A0A3P8UVF1_CYNSE
ALSPCIYSKQLSLFIVKKYFNVINIHQFKQNPLLYGPKVQALFVWSAVPVERYLLDSLPSLKVISNGGTGFELLDVQYINSRNVKVTNTPGKLSSSTADLAMGLLLASARKIVEKRFRGVEVTGATLGIIGMGNIGYKVAQRSRGFEMKVLYHNRRQRSLEDEKSVGASYCERLDDLLRRSDFVIIAVKLTPSTTGLLSHRELSLMKPEVTLINISRGQVLDQDALISALQTGTIRAAALDVTHPEPLPSDHPLLHLPNTMADNALAVVRGLPTPNEIKLQHLK